MDYLEHGMNYLIYCSEEHEFQDPTEVDKEHHYDNDISFEDRFTVIKLADVKHKTISDDFSIRMNKWFAKSTHLEIEVPGNYFLEHYNLGDYEDAPYWFKSFKVHFDTLYHLHCMFSFDFTMYDLEESHDFMCPCYCGYICKQCEN